MSDSGQPNRTIGDAFLKKSVFSLRILIDSSRKANNAFLEEYWARLGRTGGDPFLKEINILYKKVK